MPDFVPVFDGEELSAFNKWREEQTRILEESMPND